MAHRKAAIQVTNQTGVPLLSGAICRQRLDNYEIECAWEALADAQTTCVAYRAPSTGKDRRVVTWIDANGAIYVARSPEGIPRVSALILKPDTILCSFESQPSRPGEKTLARAASIGLSSR